MIFLPWFAFCIMFPTQLKKSDSKIWKKTGVPGKKANYVKDTLTITEYWLLEQKMRVALIEIGR